MTTNHQYEQFLRSLKQGHELDDPSVLEQFAELQNASGIQRGVVVEEETRNRVALDDADRGNYELDDMVVKGAKLATVYIDSYVIHVVVLYDYNADDDRDFNSAIWVNDDYGLAIRYLDAKVKEYKIEDPDTAHLKDAPIQ